MKIAVQKNHLGGLILYVQVCRSLDPSKKRRHLKMEKNFDGYIFIKDIYPTKNFSNILLRLVTLFTLEISPVPLIEQVSEYMREGLSTLNFQLQDLNYFHLPRVFVFL
mgnify:CR=1 FL=1